MAGIFYLTPVKGAVSQRLLAKGNSYFNSGGSYDLEKAAKWYKAAIFADHNLSAAYYQLARVYFVQNKLEEATLEIDKAISLNSQGTRSYYIKGLIDGYSKNYKGAIIDFKKFIEMFPKEWAGYNDLAWAYYKDNDYENAKDTLEKGLVVEPDNPWLLNGLGVSYNALGEFDKAKEVLKKTSEIAGNLSINDWKIAYPGNNASSADWDLAKFKTDIKSNLGLAYSKNPLGAIIVPACTSSCYSSWCSGCNIIQCCTDIDHGWDLGCVDTGYSVSCCPPPPPAYCGDGACNGSENCLSCPGDCGPCPGGCAGQVGQILCSTDFSGPVCTYSVIPVNPRGTWMWDCPSPNGGATYFGCTTTKKDDISGQCGPSGRDGATYCNQSQITAPCDTPWGNTPITYNGTDKKWYWKCNGQCAGAASSQCEASMGPIFDAKVGPGNGSVFCNGWPANNQLCEIYGTIIRDPDPGKYGDYTWTCKGGLCGGSNASGSAKGEGSCGWVETSP
ncbi:MAG: tetratricopeptide repeat protein [Candidatus Moraniibacteriota bacterium]